MKQTLLWTLLCVSILPFVSVNAHAQDSVIIIRHGEKPPQGDNLNCKGLNRALGIPAVLSDKFSIPLFAYVPSISCDKNTKHVRMFQTITPFAVRYNLTINSKHEVDDTKDVAKAVISKLGSEKKHGTILLVWEHKNIRFIAEDLGVKNVPDWEGTDFDSIWIITGAGTKHATLDTTAKEGLNGVSNTCP